MHVLVFDLVSHVVSADVHMATQRELLIPFAEQLSAFGEEV